MCGIVGYVGTLNQVSARPQAVVMEGLHRLEYRGYDSAGIAIAGPEGLSWAKRAGKVENLSQELSERALPPGNAAIGHTRWATHGEPSDLNAHPHIADDGRLALIHNGIIENFTALRQQLAANGVSFISQTDSEVVAHLLAQEYRLRGDLTAAMQHTVAQLSGAFTLLALHADHPGTIVAARRNSPLVIGMGEGENFLGSDVAAFIASTRQVMEVDQDQIVTITADSIEVLDHQGAQVHPTTYEVNWDATAAVKGGYDSFMMKEIHEQPRAVADTLLGRAGDDGELTLDELHLAEAVLQQAAKIVVVACGTAAYAGQVARYAMEQWCRLPVEVELAHEFRYRDPVIDEKTLVVAISQSGETMDTIMAARHARELGAAVLAIVNTQGSTLARESDAVLYTHAGPEVAVASTKAFLAQITASYLVGLYLARLQGRKTADEVADILAQLQAMPEKIQQVLNEAPQIHQLAAELKDSPSVLFLGRHVGFPVALEGALKLKELAYIHAEGFAAGELKHGPIALIEPGQPVFVIVPSPQSQEVLHAKVISNMQEIRARGAQVIAIAEAGDPAVAEVSDTVIQVPACPALLAPLLTVVPLQLFAAELATAKGLDVDQPRNLAKSVTVE